MAFDDILTWSGQMAVHLVVHAELLRWHAGKTEQATLMRWNEYMLTRPVKLSYGADLQTLRLINRAVKKGAKIYRSKEVEVFEWRLSAAYEKSTGFQEARQEELLTNPEVLRATRDENFLMVKPKRRLVNPRWIP